MPLPVEDEIGLIERRDSQLWHRMEKKIDVFATGLSDVRAKVMVIDTKVSTIIENTKDQRERDREEKKILQAGIEQAREVCPGMEQFRSSATAFEIHEKEQNGKIVKIFEILEEIKMNMATNRGVTSGKTLMWKIVGSVIGSLGVIAAITFGVIKILK